MNTSASTARPGVRIMGVLNVTPDSFSDGGAYANVAAALGVNFLAGAVLVVAMVDVPLFVNLVVETDLKRAAVVSGWILSSLTATMAAAAFPSAGSDRRCQPAVLRGPPRQRSE